jgi:chaperone modulatory protein CbpM
MEPGTLIAVEMFCSHHQIEPSFIQSLQRIGLVELVIRDDEAFIEVSRVALVEKYVRLHYDLDINLEGLEAINHLLDRVENMQDEIETLRNRLRFYEGE